ncbi:MAG: nitrogenase component 1 [Candidatus Binatia bacterium]
MSKLESQGYHWLPLKEAWESLPEIDTPEFNELCPGYEGVWCRYLWTTTYFQQFFKDVVIVTHGPLSCVAAVKNFKQTHYSLHSALPFAHSPCTNMDENAVIMGGSEILADTLRQVDRQYRPSLIIIADTCASYMIHDDVEAVIAEVEPEVKAKMVYTPSPGFAGIQCGKTLEALGPQVASLMDPPEKVSQDGVNVIGFYYDTCFTEAEGRKHGGSTEAYVHLIEGLGLKVHRIMNAGNYDYLRTASEARVNTIHTAMWGYPVAQAMEERFATPWLKRQLPMGLEGIRGWVMELAEFMGREEEGRKFVRAEEENLAPLFEEAKKWVEGKVLLVECSRNSQAKYGEMLAYSRLAQELGMKPYVYSLHPIEFKSQKDDMIAFADVEGFNPPVLIGPYPYHQPVNVEDVMADLGVDGDQCIYIYDDVFPYAKSGTFDPSSVARYTTSSQMKRVKGASFLGVGYAGTRVTYRGIVEAVKAARRKSSPTFYGRVWSSTPFEFQFANRKEKTTP